jgi:hypothetical protein
LSWHQAGTDVEGRDTMPDTPPDDPRTRLIRAAGNAIGSERFAQAIGVSPRTGYKLLSGAKPATPGILTDVRQALIEHRQRVGMLIQLIRDEEAKEPRP